MICCEGKESGHSETNLNLNLKKKHCEAKKCKAKFVELKLQTSVKDEILSGCNVFQQLCFPTAIFAQFRLAKNWSRENKTTLKSLEICYRLKICWLLLLQVSSTIPHILAKCSLSLRKSP